MIRSIAIASVLATQAFAAPRINVAIHAFDEPTGKRNIPHSHDGWMAWEKAGWLEYFNDHLNPDYAFRLRNKLTLCNASDYNRYQWSRCMAASLVHAMEKSVAETGVDVDFVFSFEYTSFDDDQCKSNCVANAAQKWLIHKPVDITLLILPKSNGSQGHTRTTLTTDNIPKAVSAIGVGGAQAFQALHLARHELGHAMGIDGHLYGEKFWFNQGKKIYPNCPEFLILPYADSGLPRSCANMTFLGDYIKPGQTCTALSMGKSHFFDTKWAVPVYGEKFKTIFGCYASKFGPQSTNPPQPIPTPSPTPKPPQNQNCAVWQNLIETHCKK